MKTQIQLNLLLGMQIEPFNRDSNQNTDSIKAFYWKIKKHQYNSFTNMQILLLLINCKWLFIALKSIKVVIFR